jgi:hypothetical protein
MTKGNSPRRHKPIEEVVKVTKDQNWFILPRKTRYDNADDSNPEVLPSSSWSDCASDDHYPASQKPDRPILSERLRNQYSGFGDHYWRDLGNFFRDWWKKRSDERTAAEQKLRDHGRDLVLQFDKFRSPDSPTSLRPVDEFQGEYVNWDQYLRKFRYRREFLQHLFTGHESIYTLFRRAVEDENRYMNTFRDVFCNIKDRMKIIARELGLPERITKGFQTSFPQESLALYIVKGINIDSRFEFRRDQYQARNVVSDDKWFRIDSFDQLLADNLVSKLNDVMDDPTVREALINYRQISVRKDESVSKFEKELETLLRSVELKTKDLLGACDHCLHLHNKKNIRQLRPLLSKID